MTPAYLITANAIDITRKIAERLVRISVVDEAGFKSDTLEIVLDDTDNITNVPPPGATLEARIGYKGGPLTYKGRFKVDEITLGGPPDTMTIRAKAMDTMDTLTDQKTRSWRDLSLASIVATIANDHNLTPFVGAALADFHYEHIDQTDESDPHFLTRLAKDYDAIAAVKNDHVIFTPKGQGQTMSGKTLPVTKIIRADGSRYNVTLAERGKAKTIIAQWHDKEAGETRNVKIGSGAPVTRLRHPYSTEAEARQAAVAKSTEIARGGDTLGLTIIGNPGIVAEAQIDLQGFRAGVNGLWSITTVTHEIAGSGGGFTTRISAEKPG